MNEKQQAAYDSLMGDLNYRLKKAQKSREESLKLLAQNPSYNFRKVASRLYSSSIIYDFYWSLIADMVNTDPDILLEKRISVIREGLISNALEGISTDLMNNTCNQLANAVYADLYRELTADLESYNQTVNN